MQLSLFTATLLATAAWAVPAPALDGTMELSRRTEHGAAALAARSNYVECHQNCVRGCTGNPGICSAVCNIACANAGEAEHETAALVAREAVDSAASTLVAREEGALAARSNYVECHQNCVRGCTGNPGICSAVCNIACANAGEAEHETAALAAREAVDSAASTLVAREGALAARSNYVECHQNCVRGCTGNPGICSAVCNIACANAGEAEHEVAALAARQSIEE
ncbi:hypothetical protein B0T14DRAFT_495215 [Immersiella caudata]|uniref:Uncharacterized protein n=1 Tax=Immersiella caudata TaxID=314043 RepID=A0AA39WY58_9PEZI|nr:hypothetical protein B0T14DRAFT_495215 [Immersiella caudata]